MLCARQGIKNSEMPLDECRAFEQCGLPVLIGTEAMHEALEHGFAGFVTGMAARALRLLPSQPQPLRASPKEASL